MEKSPSGSRAGFGKPIIDELSKTSRGEYSKTNRAREWRNRYVSDVTFREAEKARHAARLRERRISDSKYRESEKARDRQRRERRRVSAPVGATLSASAKGSLCELIVAADLTGRGYRVFRALSPDSSCDLISLRDDKCLRVEVRTASYPNHVAFALKDVGKSDVLATVYLSEPPVIRYHRTTPVGKPEPLEV